MASSSRSPGGAGHLKRVATCLLAGATLLLACASPAEAKTYYEVLPLPPPPPA